MPYRRAHNDCRISAACATTCKFTTCGRRTGASIWVENAHMATLHRALSRRNHWKQQCLNGQVSIDLPPISQLRFDHMNVLVTGGAGYIGSHTVVELLHARHEVFVIDNLCNSKISVVDRIERIAGRRPAFAEVDVRDRGKLRKLFAENRFEAVIHFAGLKAVGESMEKPLLYYDANVSGSVVLFECMSEAGVKTIVFSSSATVY